MSNFGGTISVGDLESYLNSMYMPHPAGSSATCECFPVTTNVVIAVFSEEMGTYIKRAQTEGEEDEYWSMDDRIYAAIRGNRSSYQKNWLTVIPI